MIFKDEEQEKNKNRQFCGSFFVLLKHKYEVSETFKVFKNEVENQLGKTIKAIRSDRGVYYISQEFKDYLKACGIVQQLTPPYIPQHNRVFERRNRTLLDMVWDCEARVKWDTPDKLQQRSKNIISQEVNGRVVKLKEVQDKDTSPSEITSKNPMEVEGFEPPYEEEAPIHRSVRTHRAPKRLCLNVEVEEHSLRDLNELAKYKVAMLDP
ncbi:retrotransposon protein, putative, ty1-copia subclass [Tanacetum coccineum]